MHASLARTLALSAAAAFLLASSAPGPGPRDVVARTVDEVLAVLKDASLTPEARKERIVQIAYARFDFPTMSKLVLARYWKRFDDAQREAFLKEFKDFLDRLRHAKDKAEFDQFMADRRHRAEGPAPEPQS